WGSDEFENKVSNDPNAPSFPEPWNSIDERYEARAFVEKNQKLLRWADTQRHALLKEGYKKPRIYDIEGMRSGETLTFFVETGNGTTGHSVPTGFTAERVTWLHVKVVDARGKTIFVSGDTDPNGDLRDEHSLYVHNGELEADPFLLSLQSNFLVRFNRGGESEEILPINHSVDPLPFVRPSRFSSTLTGRPQGARLEKRGIPNGTDIAQRYVVSSSALAKAQWPLKIIAEVKAGMVPVHLVNEIKEVGFDYNMSARQIGDAIHAGQMVVWRTEHQLSPQGTMIEGGAAGE
ncbi:MAG: hypothetical protein KDB07_03695, partial [Planctomycetes bacterium]|nr:hypothetical protein [Planctomycetota bacterium]